MATSGPVSLNSPADPGDRLADLGPVQELHVLQHGPHDQGHAPVEVVGLHGQRTAPWRRSCRSPRRSAAAAARVRPKRVTKLRRQASSLAPTGVQGSSRARTAWSASTRAPTTSARLRAASISAAEGCWWAYLLSKANTSPASAKSSGNLASSLAEIQTGEVDEGLAQLALGQAADRAAEEHPVVAGWRRWHRRDVAAARGGDPAGTWIAGSPAGTIAGTSR